MKKLSLKNILPWTLINRIICPLQVIKGRGVSTCFQPVSQHSVAIPDLIEK